MAEHKLSERQLARLRELRQQIEQLGPQFEVARARLEAAVGAYNSYLQGIADSLGGELENLDLEAGILRIKEPDGGDA